MQKTNLSELRREYLLQELSRTSVDADPFVQFAAWMNEAINSQVLDATAMTVSTVDAEGRPSSRVVLLKSYDANGFVFFTNYESRKASDLEQNANIALHFYWPDLERQIMINGTAERTRREESQVYFASRPPESRIAAWASKQSSTLASRQELVDRVSEISTLFKDKDIVCPPFWGGYRVTPVRIEFWQGRESRMHDRILYELNGDQWTISRLSP